MIMKQNLINNKIYSNKGFTLIEISIVLFVIAILISTTYVSEKLVSSSYLSNAINLTAQAKFANDDSLVLWLETSTLNKIKKEGNSATKWLDRSKNGILFIDTGSNVPVFKGGREFPGIKAVYFNGSGNGYLTSYPEYSSLNLSKYTSFVVVNSEGTSASRVYYGGLVLTHSELNGSRIAAIKNTGSAKYIKRSNKSNFISITNSDDLNNRPSYFYIGHNSYKGKILEIIIFDRILSDKEVNEIENYLYNKYTR